MFSSPQKRHAISFASIQARFETKPCIEDKSSAAVSQLRRSDLLNSRTENPAQKHRIAPTPPAQPENTNLLQRQVDEQSAERTTQGIYLIDRGDRSALYKDRLRGRTPAPSSLYHRTEEDSRQGRALTKFTPKVSLLTEEEKSFFRGSIQQGSEQQADANRAILQHGERLTGIAPLSEQEYGLLGPNDCRAFAAGISELTPFEERNGQVGKYWKHAFSNTSPGDCPYHCAPVVAEDCVQVTLEANQGKQGLQSPEFFIRNGIEGFMDANNGDLDQPEGQRHPYDFGRTNDTFEKAPTTSRELVLSESKLPDVDRVEYKSRDGKLGRAFATIW